MPIWSGEKLFQKDMLVDELRRIDEQLDAKKLLFAELHHFNHIISTTPLPLRGFDARA